jgi:hypothetical protein
MSEPRVDHEKKTDRRPGELYLGYSQGDPFLFKLGLSANKLGRFAKLSSHSGVPSKFEIIRSVKVMNMYDTEQTLFKTFDKYRPNKNREFLGYHLPLNRTEEEVLFTEKKFKLLTSELFSHFDLLEYASEGKLKENEPSVSNKILSDTVFLSRSDDVSLSESSSNTHSSFSNKQYQTKKKEYSSKPQAVKARIRLQDPEKRMKQNEANKRSYEKRKQKKKAEKLALIQNARQLNTP